MKIAIPELIVSPNTFFRTYVPEKNKVFKLSRYSTRHSLPVTSCYNTLQRPLEPMPPKIQPIIAASRRDDVARQRDS
jgi:hypothetical protein